MNVEGHFKANIEAARAEAQIAREEDVWMEKVVCSALVELELKKAGAKLVICKLVSVLPK